MRSVPLVPLLTTARSLGQQRQDTAYRGDAHEQDHETCHDTAPSVSSSAKPIRQA
jgi:hypothetical protein